jgi:hypothetical protein
MAGTLLTTKFSTSPRRGGEGHQPVRAGIRRYHCDPYALEPPPVNRPVDGYGGTCSVEIDVARSYDRFTVNASPTTAFNRTARQRASPSSGLEQNTMSNQLAELQRLVAPPNVTRLRGSRTSPACAALLAESWSFGDRSGIKWCTDLCPLVCVYRLW